MEAFPRIPNHKHSDANIHHSIKLKRLSFSSRHSIPRQLKNDKMFNHFYLFGGSPHYPFSKAPNLLSIFPSTSNSKNQSDDFLEQLKLFVYPSGFEEIPSNSNIFLDQFVFYLVNETSETTYGICVQFRVPINSSAYFATNLNKKYPFSLCLLSNTPFLSSHFQFASFLVSVLCGQEHISSLPPPIRRIPIPIQGFCHKSLVLDKNFPSIAVVKGFSAPRSLLDLLTYYYQLPISLELTTNNHRNSSPNFKLKLNQSNSGLIQSENNLLPNVDSLTDSTQTPDDTNSMSDQQINSSKELDSTSSNLPPPSLPKPPQTNRTHTAFLSDNVSLSIPYALTKNQCVIYPTFSALFSCLTPIQIIQIYTALLLERSILFVSESHQLISFSVIASTHLLLPFITQANVMPVLPNNGKYQSILESPVPFVAGSSNKNGDADLIVDLDNGTITLPDDMPQLPRYQELLSKLDDILKHSLKQILVPPKEIKSFFSKTSSANPKYEEFIQKVNSNIFPSNFSNFIPMKYILTSDLIEEILSLFSEFFPLLLKDAVMCCFVTDSTDPDNPIRVFNKGLFNEFAAETDKDFFDDFTSTQIFTAFCDKIEDNYESEKTVINNRSSPKREFLRSHSLLLLE